jgi:colanic acid/amylovoran biosynthesis glycosyltransferase
MLAIAAKAFNSPSETFIRDHVRSIAPGTTVLLCFAEESGVEWEVPTLAGLRPDWRAAGPLLGRALAAASVLLARHVRPGLPGGKRRQVVEFLRQHQVRAVLAEYGPTGCDLMEACSQAGVPLFVHFHGYDASMLLNSQLWRRSYLGLFGMAAGIIAPSRFLGEKLVAAGCPVQLLHVSACGIDPARFVASSRIPQRLVAVGRLVEKKAPHLTISAVARIADRFPQLCLDLVGDGPLMRECRRRVEEYGLQTRVRLHGARPPHEVARYLRESSIFLQHSVTAENGDCEGMPVAILEAMASALPVVSTRHSGIPEAVQHGVTGLLSEERDVDGMAAAIGQLLVEPDRAEAMGLAGRRRVLDQFTQQQACDRLRAIMGPGIGPDRGRDKAVAE